MKTPKPMESLTLILSATNQQVVVNDVIYLIAKSQCCIEESRFVNLGNEFVGVMHLCGTWNAIAKMEDALSSLKDHKEVHIDFKRATPLNLEGNFLPYIVQIVGLNTPSLVNEITHFFVEQKIQLIDLQTDPFKSSYSETKMLTIGIRVHIPATVNIADLRERFMVLCEELNVDAILEPEKTLK